jgi:hypothetical protein
MSGMLKRLEWDRVDIDINTVSIDGRRVCKCRHKQTEPICKSLDYMD